MLCLDVCTRWNSTYLMLDTAQNFERAFERFEEQDTKFKAELELGEDWPTIEDWSKEEIKKIEEQIQELDKIDNGIHQMKIFWGELIDANEEF
ncbi:hypothetical protein HRI_001258200 [Hibiscus trionum]|uniref:Zinc finger BED domain-containing protein RICESLEEPER 2-like n=1 Tax=Hibiscus trionum TaxID=183268 RepID=A0A9W7LSU4_HIBTR|nr:hypothetical protein HRI_001258200 [Hibiscus trionum]